MSEREMKSSATSDDMTAWVSHRRYITSLLLLRRDAEGLAEAILVAHGDCKDERGLLMIGAEIPREQAVQIAEKLIEAGIFAPESR